MELKKNFARALFAVFAAASVDGYLSEGEYGGAALDKAGFNNGANIYRAVARGIGGYFKFMGTIAGEEGGKWKEFFDYYGSPKP